MGSKFCYKRGAAICLLVTSVILFIATVTVLAVFPILFQNELYKRLILLKGTLEFDLWRTLPIPISLSFHFFNITNPEEFIEGSQTLKVQEVGPYVYQSKWLKENIRWYPNKTVSYQERRSFFFDEENSVGSEDDSINTLNGPMIVAASVVKDKSIIERMGLSALLYGYKEKLVTSKKIGELTFTGYEDPIITFGASLIKDLPFKDGIFSWMYGKNDTYDGTFTVSTGEDDISKLNVINNFNGEEQLSFWKNDSCNFIKVPSGEVGPPLEEHQEDFSFFQSLLCRTITLSRAGEGTYYGLTYKSFEPNFSVFANSTINPANACFERKPMLTGVQDVGPCQFNAPAYMSFPHFHMADPEYLKPIVGLRPNASDHSSHLKVEPTTGVSLEILLRLQINLQLEPISWLEQFSKVPNGLFPVFWIELRGYAPPDLAKFFARQLNMPKILVYTLGGILLASSVAMFVTALVMLYRQRRENDHLIHPITTSKAPATTYSSVSQECPAVNERKSQRYAEESDDDPLLYSGKVPR